MNSGYNVLRRVITMNSKYHTTSWCKKSKMFVSGDMKECMKYQKQTLEYITKHKLEESKDRISIIDNRLNEQTKDELDGNFNYTNRFDLKLNKGNYKYNFNLKFLLKYNKEILYEIKDEYNFIVRQAENKVNYVNNVKYINILAGDMSYEHIDKFRELLNSRRYKFAKNKVFVGSLYEFNNSEMLKQITK